MLIILLNERKKGHKTYNLTAEHAVYVVNNSHRLLGLLVLSLFKECNILAFVNYFPNYLG